MELTEAQTKIVEDLHRFRVLICGRKFGKTTLASQELLGAAVYIDGARILYVAPTLGDARRLMWDRMKHILGKTIIKENDTRMEITVPTVNKKKSTLFLGSWELVNNYRGDEFNLIIFDEVQDYKDFWVGWQEAMRPTLTPRKGTAMFMGTPKGFNHLYDLYNAEYQDTNWKSFRFSSYDNPFIDKEEIDAAKKDQTEDRFAQEYLAEFRKKEGLVFPEFDRNKHLYEEEIRTTTTVVGIDWGYHVAAVPIIKIKDNTFYVDDLLYRGGMTDEEVADWVATRKPQKAYPDPENPGAIKLLKQKGVNVREVKKGPGSIEHGCQAIRELFKQNRLFIHKRCLGLINELEMYSYPEKRLNHSENENPQDEFNHAIDALRYVVDNHVIAKPYIPRPFNDRMKTVWAGR